MAGYRGLSEGKSEEQFGKRGGRRVLGGNGRNKEVIYFKILSLKL